MNWIEKMPIKPEICDLYKRGPSFPLYTVAKCDLRFFSLWEGSECSFGCACENYIFINVMFA